MVNKTYIIAEAGVNHNGNLDLALKLVEVAKKAGADAVKFQTFKTEKLVSNTAPKADYQLRITSPQESQSQMISKLELSKDDHLLLMKYAQDLGIDFLSSPFDEESIEFLDDLGVKIFKIPSGEITNKKYLQSIAAKNKPVILSTGMADMKEIADALDVLAASGLTKENLTILHCTTEYPTPLEHVNLKAMLAIKNEFSVQIGYSDHTLGIEVPLAAVALGATVIEKHLTLNRNYEGPDHKASLEPDEFKNMVDSIRNIELAVSGDGCKKPGISELRNKIVARKSLHLGKSLPAGHILSYEDIIALRPGDGISPMEIDSIVNRVLKVAHNKHHKLSWLDLE